MWTEGIGDGHCALNLEDIDVEHVYEHAKGPVWISHMQEMRPSRLAFKFLLNISGFICFSVFHSTLEIFSTVSSSLIPF